MANVVGGLPRRPITTSSECLDDDAALSSSSIFAPDSQVGTSSGTATFAADRESTPVAPDNVASDVVVALAVDDGGDDDDNGADEAGVVVVVVVEIVRISLALPLVAYSLLLL
jgi:hypothetical protein